MEKVTVSKKGLRKLFGKSFLSIPYSFFEHFDTLTSNWLAFMLSQYERFDTEDDYFYFSQANIELYINITPKQQASIIKELAALNIISYQLKGLTAKNYYKINIDVLINHLEMDKQEQDDRDVQLRKFCVTGNADSEEPATQILPDSLLRYNNKIKNKENTKVFSRSPAKASGPVPNSLFSGYSEDVRDVFNYWHNYANEGALPKTKLVRSKTFDRALKQIKNTLKEYPIEQITEAIDDYEWLLSNEDIKGVNKTFIGNRVGIDQFFEFNAMTVNTMSNGNVAKNIKSWFDECLNGRDYLLEKYAYLVKNEYPAVVKELEKQWLESPYSIGNKVNTQDINNFRKCAVMLVNWVDKQDRDYPDYDIDDSYFDHPEYAVKLLFGAIKHSLNGFDPKEVGSGWLCSDKMFEARLHLYMKNVLGKYIRLD